MADVTGQDEQKKTKVSERVDAIDALRGFDMFWIAGGEGIIHTMARLTNWPFFLWCSYELSHSIWNGFTAYDLIFPLFLFLAGSTVPFSFRKRLSRGQTKKDLYRHVVSRVVILIALGLVYNGFFNFNFVHMRYASVLARIGLGWGFAALIYMNTDSWKTRMAWFWGILFGYWLLLLLVPVPGVGAYVLTKGGWLGSYIDRHLLPGSFYTGIHDPEGILSTVPAIATGLMGMMTGQLLSIDTEKLSKIKKGLILLVAGLIFLGLAQLWNLVFPINKNMWTSSFVLYTSGWSMLLLSAFYFIMDIMNWKRWAFFFVVIGSNSIVAYFIPDRNVIDFHPTVNFFMSGIVSYFTFPVQSVLLSIGFVAVAWLFLYFLYKKKLFFKI